MAGVSGNIRHLRIDISAEWFSGMTMPTASSLNQANPRAFKGTLARPPRFYKQWMIAGNPAYFFDRLIADFGDFVHYRGLFNFYLVNHPALVKQVLLETHETFDKNSVIYDRFRNAFGDGLVVSEGQRWRRQRKLMQPMFGPLTVKRYFDSMLAAASAMVDRWGPLCRNQEVFDVAEEMNQVTLEIAGRAFFHEGFHQASEQISRWTRTINHYSAKPPLPIVRSLWFPSSTNRKLKNALREFHAFLSEMIAARRGSTQHQDLLSILLQARHEESGEPMTDQEIIEEVLGMIIGGHETSSAAMAWTWYELDRQPEVRERLQEEIDRVLGNRPMTIEDVPRLEYARMILEESLRLHPPFWFENRNTMAEVELGGATLPQGSLVVFSRYSLHRHVDFWSRPDQFDPNRFTPEKEENKRSTYAYIPFGGGPRICIGMHFAMLELLVLLTVVARTYRVRLDRSHRHEMAAHLTMTPKYGVRARLERR